MNSYETYQQMLKPSWAPPGRLFGPAWTILYILIIISYGYVIKQVIHSQLSRTILIPFAINIIANALFTYLWFTKNNLLLGLIDVFVVLITIVTTMVVIRTHYRWVAYMQIPYLIRVCFATVLAGTVYFMNK